MTVTHACVKSDHYKPLIILVILRKLTPRQVRNSAHNKNILVILQRIFDNIIILLQKYMNILID